MGDPATAAAPQRSTAGGDEDPAQLAAACCRRPRPWLLGVDVDGTLAPIVSRPELARLEPMAREAIERLVATPGVTVAVVSGRPLADLRHRFEIPSGALLIGSHGAEIGTEVDRRTPDEEVLMQSTTTSLKATGAELHGSWIEHKPLAVAFHVRQADDHQGELALAALQDTFERVPGLTMHRGHKVLEFAVRPTSKRLAFGQLVSRLEPTTAMFIGDDSSDEAVFGSLREADVSIKVGPGTTAAQHRLAGPAQVVALLDALQRGISTDAR
ncbi:MAG: trehalose-phosphatase [Acidimicrobiales bacterium]|nr:trehalose-phosphatase [Acidimicrobiales bacterium]